MLTHDEIWGALPDRLTVAQAAALLGVSKWAAYRRIKAGRLHAEPGRGGAMTVPKAEVRAYLEDRTRRGLR